MSYNKVLIVACDYPSYGEYCRKHDINPYTGALYITDIFTLRGLSGDIVVAAYFTWWNELTSSNQKIFTDMLNHINENPDRYNIVENWSW